MSKIDISVNCESVNVAANTNRLVVGELLNADSGEILDHFSPEDITSHFNHDDLLKHIEVSTVKKYFDLVEP